MGNCNSSGATRPYKFSLNELKHLRIGETEQMGKGCGPAIEGPSAGDNQDSLKIQGFGWPENDEFEYGGMGDNCGLCSNHPDYGCECHGGDAIGGRRGKVKRKAFKGDPTNCCFANIEIKDSQKIDGDFTCDPKYRDPGGTDCTNIYADYCKIGDRAITDDKCKKLGGSNITLFNTLMTDKCNLDEFYKTAECINWCKNNSTQCNKLNTFQSCQEFGIDQSECTPQKVLDVKTDCQKYGIRSEQGLAVSQCSPASIKALVDQCKEYNILDSCSPSGIQDAIDNATRAAQLEMQARTQEQIQQNYETTQKTIADILNLTEEPSEITPTAKSPVQNIFDINNIQQWIKDNYNTTIIIIVVIIFLIISSSSVSGLLLLM